MWSLSGVEVATQLYSIIIIRINNATLPPPFNRMMIKPIMATVTAASSSRLLLSPSHQTTLLFSSFFTKPPAFLKSRSRRLASTTTTITTNPIPKETIFFDGGAHYGDLVANLLLGFTLVWLPLTVAAVLRGFFLRYRFTNLRVTVISGLTGQDRSDFSYKVIKDVQVVPRFIGEWGDVVITLKDGTKVDLRSVPRFRQIATYCSSMADESEQTAAAAAAAATAKGF